MSNARRWKGAGMRRGWRGARSAGAAAAAAVDWGYKLTTLPWVKVATLLAEPGAQVATYTPMPFPATDGSTYTHAILIKREDTNTQWMMLSNDGVNYSDYDSRATVIDGTTFGGSGGALSAYAVNVAGTIYVYIQYDGGVGLASIAEGSLGSITSPTDWTNVDADIVPTAQFGALGLSSARPHSVFLDSAGDSHCLGHAYRASDTAYVIWHSKGTSWTDLTSIQPVEIVLEPDTYGTGASEVDENNQIWSGQVFAHGGINWLQYSALTNTADDQGGAQGLADLHLATIADLDADSWVGNITKDPEGRRLIARGGAVTGAVGAGLRAGYDENYLYASRLMMAQSGQYLTPAEIGGNVQLYTSVRSLGSHNVSTGLAQIDSGDFMTAWQTTYPDLFAIYEIDEESGLPQDTGPWGHHWSALNDGSWDAGPPAGIMVAGASNNPPVFPVHLSESDLSLADIRTAMGWVYFDDTLDGQRFAWVVGHTVGSAVQILQQPAGSDLLRMSWFGPNIDSPVLATNYYHVAMVYDGPGDHGPAKTPYFFVDGTKYTGAVVSRLTNVAHDRFFGGYKSGGRSWGDTVHGPWELWTKALSPTQIQAHFDATKAAFGK